MSSVDFSEKIVKIQASLSVLYGTEGLTPRRISGAAAQIY
jgi:hypothetical protein